MKATRRGASESAEGGGATMGAPGKRTLTGAIQRKVVQRKPEVGWTGQKSMNAGTHTLDERGKIDGGGANDLRRIPLRGIGSVPSGKVIALVPGARTLDGATSIEVLLHFHGAGPGNQEVANGKPPLPGAPPRNNDVDVSQIGQQVASSGRAMIGILPEGGAVSNRAALVDEVFAKLRDDGLLGEEQVPGRTIYSGHSMGTTNTVAEATKHANASPDDATGLFLFDPMADVNATWVLLENRLKHDRAQLLGLSGNSDQLDYLATRGFVFRAYGQGWQFGPKVKQMIDKVNAWFGQAQNTAGIDPDVVGAWQVNYDAKSLSARNHDSMVSTGQDPPGGAAADRWSPDYTPGSGNLEDALGAL